MVSLEESFKYCEQLTQSHYENFPVGSFLLPKEKRRYIWAIYAYARTADDFADEGRTPAESQKDLKKRLDLLDDWERKLEDSLKGKSDHPVFMALSETIRQCGIPTQLLKDLLTAYRMDVQKKRYRNFEEALTYCRYSANPVGRLVLYTFGYTDEILFQQSDSICTALQLTNFWQDIVIDLAKDRIYIPQEDMERYKITEEDLHREAVTPSFQSLMECQAKKTARLFNEGLPLIRGVNSDLKLEMRLTWLGGTSILKKTIQNGYDVFQLRPKLYLKDKILLLGKALLPFPISPLNNEQLFKNHSVQ